MKNINEINKLEDVIIDENKKKMIISLLKELKKFLKNEITGHDYWHALRVLNLSLYIAKKEAGTKKKFKIDYFKLALASIVHDISDWKVNSKINAKDLLIKIGFDKKTINDVLKIIKEISFKGALVKESVKSIEAKILQDADRLDALGAIGISRCFATGAKLGKIIYDPEIKPKMHKSFASYKRSKSTSINHFYEKLFLLRKRMNTKTAKILAKERERFMKCFLKKFFDEWYLKDLR